MDKPETRSGGPAGHPDRDSAAQGGAGGGSQDPVPRQDPGGSPSQGSPSQGSPSGGSTSPPPRRPRRELRRRLALLVLVVGIAGLVAYWSRSRPVEVTLIYDMGRLAPRVTELEIAYQREGGEMQPVKIEFPASEGAPRRYRHTLQLVPGDYTLHGRIRLRGDGEGGGAELRRITRHLTVKSGQDQRLTVRIGHR